MKTMMSKPAFAVVLLVSIAWGPVRADEGTAPAMPATTPAASIERLGAAEVETLFLADADPQQRDAIRKKAVRLAMAGDGYAAFDLGVLFRHGMDHPAGAVERDLDTARY